MKKTSTDLAYREFFFFFLKVFQYAHLNISYNLLEISNETNGTKRYF